MMHRNSSSDKLDEGVASDKVLGHSISIGSWSVSRHMDMVHIRILWWSCWQLFCNYSVARHTTEVSRGDEYEHAACM